MDDEADYSEECELDDEDDLANDCEGLFPFEFSHRAFLERLDTAVRQLIALPTTLSSDIYCLSKVLLAIERLPRPTPLVSCVVSLEQKHFGESFDSIKSMSLCISENEFTLKRAWATDFKLVNEQEYVCENTITLEPGGYCEMQGNPSAWVKDFSEFMMGKDVDLVISDYGEPSGIEWDVEGRDEDWERLRARRER